MQPDEPRPRETRKPRAATTLPASALTFALARGVPITDLEEATGVPIIEIVSADGHLPDDLPPRIMSSIARSKISSAPALEMAQMAPFSMFRGLERVAAYAPNGFEVLKVFHDFGGTLAERAQSWFHETETLVAVHFTHPLDALDDGLTHESHLALVWRFLRNVMGRNLALREVGFGFSAHGAPSQYRDVFDAPVRFGRQPGEHLLVFDKASLEAPNPNANFVLYESGRLQLQEIARQLKHDDACPELQRLMEAAVACAERDMFQTPAVATAAGMTLRQAQRVATRCGVALRDLIEGERTKRAKLLMLGDPSVAFSTVAADLGYSDERAFRRFFKRAVGVTPTEYRALAAAR